MKSSVVYSFKSLPQAELSEFAANVIAKMTQDPQFVGLKPQVDALKAAYDLYQVAASNAKDGGKIATLEKNDRLEVLVFELSTVARYVDVLANESELVVLAAGFNVRKKATPVTELATPTNVIAKNLEQNGVARLSWAAVEGSTIYAIERRTKGTESWRNGDYRGGISAQLEGLEINTTFEFRIMAIHSTGIKSNWSQPAEVLIS